MSRFPRLALVLLVALALSLAPPLLAQSQATTGVIEGTVADQNGSPLPGASVDIKNTATDFDRIVVTAENGKFRGILLPLGPYRVTVTLQGFATLVREGLNLELGQTISLQLPMKLSAVSEQVTVTGAAPVVETARASTSRPSRSCRTTGATSWSSRS
jgi:hypothetical protein